MSSYRSYQNIVEMAINLMSHLRDEEILSPQMFSPHLIDLVQYEKNLLYAREHGKPPVPVQPIPKTSRQWTASEMQAMRDNREKANDILKRIFPE
jgi:hypothetical protein